MRRIRLLALGGLASAILSCNDSTAPPALNTDTRGGRVPAYQFITLPETFSPTALNRKLAIVGLKLPANWPPVGVVWTPTEGVTALPLPPDAQWANPTSINDRGEVAGITVFPTQGYQATHWDADGAVRTLGNAYYIPGASVNNQGEVAWVEVLGPFSDPTGFGIWLSRPNGTQSIGILPYDPNENGDYFAPFRLTDKGGVLWGYGRWVYSRDRKWKQYTFPNDVTTKSLVDVNKFGTVIGSGYWLTIAGYSGFVWNQPDLPVALPKGFLPVRILDDGTMLGQELVNSLQVPTIRKRDGTNAPLPIPEAPAGYTFSGGFIFAATDEGQAVGFVTYVELNAESPNVVGVSILWTRTNGAPPQARLARAGKGLAPLTDASRRALCLHSAATNSALCRNVAGLPRVAGRH